MPRSRVTRQSCGGPKVVLGGAEAPRAAVGLGVSVGVEAGRVNWTPTVGDVARFVALPQLERASTSGRSITMKRRMNSQVGRESPAATDAR